MQLGLIGLGKMGGNMAERLRLGGHQVVGFDFNAEAVQKLTASGNVGVSSLEDMAKNLTGRKAIWIMVPQGKPVDDTIAKLEPLLNPGRHSDRWRQLELQGLAAPLQGSDGEGISVCRRGHVGRCVGLERGLQHDDRRR